MRNSFLRGCRKDIKRLISFAVDSGWSVDRSQKQHVKFTKPGRQPVFTSGTPSDRRAWLNAKSQLAQADKLAGGATC